MSVRIGAIQDHKESMTRTSSLPVDYWKSTQVTRQDMESLHAYLFEAETPLTTNDLASKFVSYRIQAELAALNKLRVGDTRAYLPKEKYAPGATTVFPALDWRKGRITAVRSGFNPEAGAFDVITVAMEDGPERMFAAGLSNHILNEQDSAASQEDELNPEIVLQENGIGIEQKLETAFSQDDGLVKIAGRWFARGLLIDINEGQLNLAEAVLDMAQGEPQPTSALLKDVELPSGVNPKLAEFSLNYALQDDPRFDAVGPPAHGLWCLPRL